MNRLTKTALVLVFFAVLLTACRREPAVPLPDGLPDAEIVFMPGASPVVSSSFTSSLGFIDAGGNNRSEYTFSLLTGWYSMFGLEVETQHIIRPRWANSGNMLVFSIRAREASLRLIDNNGRMIGSDCRVRVEGVSFDQYGNVLVDVHRLVEIEEYELADIIGSDRTLVARYDLQTCRIVETLSLPVPEAYSIGESRDGILAANYFEDGTMIILYDPQNGETNYLRGYYPSFSDDGRWLAYYTPNGELMVRSLQDGGEQLLDASVFSDGYFDFVGMPGWSPDSRWLVYNTQEGMIFKVNRETGERVYLTDGWAPDWR